MWRSDGKKLELAWQAHAAAIQALAFSPGEHTLVTGSWDGTIKLWNLERGALLWLGQHTGSIHRLVFTPDGRTLASSGDDAAIRLWDVTTGKLVQTVSYPGGAVYALAWSPDGERVAVARAHGDVAVWNLNELERVLTRAGLGLKPDSNPTSGQ